ncbi:MBL fold metallo-hydrolase [Clostridium thermosuccinogenes]|uniref:MBL fold metallo-hydrolase n=1 Tax=Clostridium thermosuccinogenes TaxID=84032 RepID=A0A2K2FBR9_9CLOT|nr:MBL fold metallo-hydrolase [Pseudoclostridium thermosuccinogenes]AUS98527.1 MBL fold metallo-hydrolase [Pseudoclostridium thermosuccinogenes]PNT95318.1 MBL fold metallo-hydrolase [Pseudoclostridium thermosuccinogenes]PNT96230.1 MBL fold metallo-hydrolase [Pseudoclostridium thermosuccinogenes]
MIKFCSLFSGSSGNSLYIEANGTKILIDAGLSGKRIIQALNSIGEQPSEISAVLVTHEHSDHIRGVGILSRKFNIPVYANEKTWDAMGTQIGPINADNMRCFTTGKEFEIGNLCIKPFPIPHDASEPVGFNFFAENKKVTTATDIGHITKEVLESLIESDLVLLESNHDIEMLKVGPYPWPLKRRILGDRGHLSNEMAGKVAVHMAQRGTRKFLLGHLSKENNFPELAYQTVYNALSEQKIKVGSDVTLEVAMRDYTGSVITL